MDAIDLTHDTTPASGLDDQPERSLGQLVADAAAELSTLVRQEIALAKAELTRSVTSAVTGAGALVGAAVTALLALVFLSLAAMFGLEAAGLPMGVAALAIAVGWLLLAGALGVAGKRKFGSVGGVPRTTKTIKEDVEWIRHPTS